MGAIVWIIPACLLTLLGLPAVSLAQSQAPAAAEEAPVPAPGAVTQTPGPLAQTPSEDVPRTALESAPGPSDEVPNPTEVKKPGLALAAALLVPTVTIYLGFGYLEDSKVLGLTLIGLGATLGPSAGHFYSGEIRRGLLFSLGRTALQGAGYYALTTFWDQWWNDPPPNVLLLVAGLAAGAVGNALLVWNLIDAPASARRANARSAVSLAPLLLPDGPPGGERRLFAGLRLDATY